MSASREKKTRQNQTSTGWNGSTSPRTEKKGNAMYTIIAVVFVLVAAAAIIWRSNVIPKTATAATIDGVDYKVSEVDFYYANTVNNFMSSNYQQLAMMGVNINAPLDDQVIPEGVAAYLELDPETETTWREFFLQKTLDHMASVQAVLKTAEEEGFVYPDSVQADYEETMSNLATSAAASGVSTTRYLQSQLSRTMTEKIYGEHVLRTLQYGAYLDAYIDSLSYSEQEMTAAYNADPKAYDKVSYEVVNFSTAPEAKTDADGNAIEATPEETEAAKTAAKAAAEEMLAAYRSGSDLATLATDAGMTTYSSNDQAAYSQGAVVAEWLFDDARKAGDTAVLENGSNYALVVFHKRFRQNEDTIDVRHILIAPEAGTLTSKDEGYDAEQTELKAAAHTKADEILAQWTAGEATEDSFAQLAKENSADSNASRGGLYEMVAPGDMVETFNDWCFADGRKAGDTGVVDTDFGSHVMYFVGTNLPKWQADVTATLSSNDFDQWIEQFGADYTTELHSFGSKFVA